MFKRDNEQNSEIMNWNAGTQFNDIIGMNKMLYINNISSKNYEILFEVLSTDFDLTYEKMYLESTIRKNEDSVKIKNELNAIRQQIDKINMDMPKSRNSRSFNDQLRQKITSLRRKIWDLQGRLGVLFPFDSKKKLDPSEAVRDF